MKFDLVRPCAHCPFRSDIKPYLRAGRVEDIERSLERSTFACHETTVESDDDDGSRVETDESKHCAGALILMEKSGKSSQMMRIAERLLLYDARKLDMESPVFNDFEAMIDAQSRWSD